VTFESGSKLSRIEDQTFLECSSLSSICLPATLSEVVPGAFDDLNLKVLSIEAGSRHFKVRGPFLLNFPCTSVIRCFGAGKQVAIPRQIKDVCCGCFRGNAFVRDVIFEPGSQVSCIEEFAFSNCSSLSSIWTTSSVELLCDQCFDGCKGLSSVAFEPGSKLSRIDWRAFGDFTFTFIDLHSVVG
jgi:hypothetical protein